MKTRIVLVCGLMLVFLLGMWSSPPSAGQAPFTPPIGARQVQPKASAPPSKVGKYQLAIGGVNGALLYLCDTETGHVWGKTAAGWTFIASPPVAAPAKNN